PSPSPGNNSAQKTPATCGPIQSVLSASVCQPRSCLKMCPGFADTCPWSSETCDELATPSRGPSWLPAPQWVRDILVAASGYMPTPTKHGNYNRKGASKHSGDGLSTVLKRRLPTAKATHGGPDYQCKARGAGGDSLVTTLNKAQRLPTLTATGGSNRSTPAKDGTPSPLRPNIKTILKHSAPTLTGPVNPDWLDWYMGFPIGWSGLKPLAKRRFQQWCEQHGICSEGSE
ncbi:hypothetical protein LCGC14_1156520, partial [marine sediment metagenome]